MDHDFFLHRKVERLSKDAKLVFIAGLAHCSRELSDGFISAGAALRTILAAVDAKPRAVNELVDAGLWHKEGDGFVVHDYHDYQPPAEQVRKQRRDHAERMRRWRNKRDGPSDASRDASTSPSRDASRDGVSDAGCDGVSDTARDAFNSNSNNLSLSTVTNDGRWNGCGEEKLEAKDPFVERVVTAVGDSPKVRRDATAAVHHWRSYLDSRLIDEAIGRAEHADQRPRSVAYFDTTVQRTALSRGVRPPESA